MPTVHAAVGALDARPEVASGRYGLVGFSFGAPQAVTASGRGGLSDRIGAVVSFGGYCDIERTLRCSLTRVREWKGVARRIDPDPYGRWVIGSNYLTNVPAARTRLMWRLRCDAWRWLRPNGGCPRGTLSTTS